MTPGAQDGDGVTVGTQLNDLPVVQEQRFMLTMLVTKHSSFVPVVVCDCAVGVVVGFVVDAGVLVVAETVVGEAVVCVFVVLASVLAGEEVVFGASVVESFFASVVSFFSSVVCLTAEVSGFESAVVGVESSSSPSLLLFCRFRKSATSSSIGRGHSFAIHWECLVAVKSSHSLAR